MFKGCPFWTLSGKFFHFFSSALALPSPQDVSATGSRSLKAAITHFSALTARGIGCGIAQALAREGYRVIITGRRPVHDLEAIGLASDWSRYFQADVASSPDREQLVKAVKEEFGRLDVLVNNAGIAPRVRADVLEATEESFDEVMGTNLKGPYFLTQLAARWMVQQAQAEARYRDCIVNISSCSATVASVNRGDYCISKAGVAMATRLWAVRLAEFGIDVYEIRPGIIATEMTGKVKEKYDRMIENGLLLEKRWGTAADIGRAVAMLAPGDLPYATGSVLSLDGGMTLARL